MRARDEQALRKHFQSWSGGFPPDSEHEITVYVDYARLSRFDPDETREALRKWASEEWGLEPPGQLDV